MGLDYKKVEVLMSTYNGSKYVGRQIESILNQEGVNIHLTIRDDGSNDDTVKVLRIFQNNYPDKIKIIEGDNIGYKRSFLSLLSLAEDADFYSFSDQDDIWEINKIFAAIDFIGDIKTVLYVSNLDIYDENLNKIGKTSFSQSKATIYREYIRHQFAGCTYVFDNELLKIISVFSNLDLPKDKMPSHDALICRCAYACGNVIVDDKSYIKHIRYSHSMTAGGNGLIKRIKTEWKTLKAKNLTSETARLILNNNTSINKQYIPLLKVLSTYRVSIKSWMSLFFNPFIKSGRLYFDFIFKLKVLLRSY